MHLAKVRSLAIITTLLLVHVIVCGAQDLAGIEQGIKLTCSPKSAHS